MRNFIVLIAVIFFGTQANGQNTPFGAYTFDSCDFTEQNGLLGDAISFGALDCVCGVSGNAMEFGDGLDSLLLPAEVSTIFSQDFTLSFYVKFTETNGRFDIISARTEDCQVDSSFVIRYIGVTNEISVEYGENFNNLIELFAPLESGTCWHHIVFSRNDLDYFLYYNGELIDQERATKELVIDPINSFQVSNSACNGILDNSFQGFLDELIVYDEFLNPASLSTLSLFPDQIINQDTTIFLGDAVQVITGESCSTTPMWSPVAGVDNPTVLEPVLTPTESTTYTLDLPGQVCSTMDQIVVNVIDSDQLNCQELLLPNAFTPNGDQLNDLFGISNSFIIEDLKRFEIFDRWGEKVFETEDKNAQWDGYFRSQPVNPAMYLYVVSYVCLDEEYVKSGSVSVLR